jgi:hypothetical protein
MSHLYSLTVSNNSLTSLMPNASDPFYYQQLGEFQLHGGSNTFTAELSSVCQGSSTPFEPSTLIVEAALYFMDATSDDEAAIGAALVEALSEHVDVPLGFVNLYSVEEAPPDDYLTFQFRVLMPLPDEGDEADIVSSGLVDLLSNGKWNDIGFPGSWDGDFSGPHLQTSPGVTYRRVVGEPSPQHWDPQARPLPPDHYTTNPPWEVPTRIVDVVDLSLQVNTTAANLTDVGEAILGALSNFTGGAAPALAVQCALDTPSFSAIHIICFGTLRLCF